MICSPTNAFPILTMSLSDSRDGVKCSAMSLSAEKRSWSQDTSRLIRSLLGRSELTPRTLMNRSSYPPKGQLNEDILRHIIPYLSPETLNKANAANWVFFDAWMKSRYESLTLVKNDETTKRLLAHLGYVTNRFILAGSDDSKSVAATQPWLPT